MTIAGWLYAMTDDKINSKGQWMCEHCLIYKNNARLRSNQWNEFLKEFTEMYACDDCACKFVRISQDAPSK